MDDMNMKSINVVNFAARQRGASLLEGIAYLGIAALVILGAVSLLTGAFGSAQSNRTAEEFVAIRTAAKKLYMGQAGSYDSTAAPGGMTAALIAANALPATVNVVGGVINNTFGGTVTVVGNTAGTQFTIQYTNVPQEVCTNLISTANGWVSASAGAAGTTAAPTLNAAGATTACAAGANIVKMVSV